MSPELDELRLERPPVSEVRLAFIFGTVGRLRATYVGGLYQQWRGQYPEAFEGPPLRPFNRNDGDYEFLSEEDDYWPIPYTRFSNTESGQSIAYQFDRLAIVWEFDSERPAYPGFDVLATELVTRFAEFNRLLADSPAGPAQITHTECQYVNNVNGITPRQYARGLTNGWESAVATADDPGLESLIMSQHLHFDDSDDGAWVAVAPLEGEKEGAELTIRSLHMVTDSEADWRQELDASHNIATRSFMHSTSPAMRKAWGAQ